jgi:hypothetical protein
MAEQPEKPVSDDLRADDEEYNPAVEPKSAKAWINLIEESEKAFEPWNNHCDKIDKLYGNLEQLASMGRDKQFAMFWANCEVIKPSIYAKPPVPVVVPKFKDRRPVYQAASEVAERVAHVSFDMAHINDVMMLIRDDVAICGRGVPWCRYESGKSNDGYDSYYVSEKVCIDYKPRRDFLHSISRTWPEVWWVAAASYLTRAEARKRFYKHSGNAYQDADYKVDRDAKEVGGADKRERACFWEIWNRKDRRCVWVAKGVEKILDEDKAHLDLPDFFPCPKPAYGVVQRGSLVPVPDVLQYKDQLDEINLLTARIHALSDALEVRGFYPAGGAEIGDAVQAAVQHKTSGRVLVPISNWSAFGGSKEVIIWLPIDMIAQTITALVALRKQIIEDVYQIMGLSDIMRGATDPHETLGAQQLKTEYGSTRIRDKQSELVRVARDLVDITLGIAFEQFSPVTIIEMSQTQLPTQQMLQAQMQQVIAQVQAQQQQALQMMQNPQAQQQLAQQPGQGQQLIEQFTQAQAAARAQLEELSTKPTIEQVLAFLKDNRAKAFVLDIETDSTILADENAEKQRRTEFVQMLGGLLPQLSTMIAAEPKTAEFCGELLKFSTAPFRAGRTLDGAIDNLVQEMKQKATQGAGDDPVTATNKNQLQIEQMKDARQREKDKQDAALKEKELANRQQIERERIQSQERMKRAEMLGKSQDDAAKAQQTNQKAMHDREEHQATMVEKQQDAVLDRQKADTAARLAAQKANQQAQQAADRRAAQQFRMTMPRGGAL